MARVKGAMMTRKRRNKMLKLAKGYWGAKSKHFKMANEQVMKSLTYAYVGRRLKKRDFRQLWITRISAACKINGMNYSTFMHGLKLAGVEINRKMLAELAVNNKEAFAQLAETAQKLQQMRYDAYDALEQARDLRGELDVSPEDIDRMESRLDLLYRLGKKYGSTVDEMLSYLQKCREELDQIQYSSDRIGQLEKKLERQCAEAREKGEALTGARRAAAVLLQQRIQKELTDLDMPKVRFEVQIEPKDTETGMDATGMDQVRFLMSANVGEALKPINKIASGGELSRIMLALKNVLAESDDVSTLVFDEVDTGVSGRAAIKVARKMAQVARQKQILCVTHLPQIASMADTHFFVEKGERKGRTYTDVRILNRKERMEELARLTGGEQVTPAMLESAGELLDEAAAYKKKLAAG